MAEHAGKPKVRFAGFTETWEQREFKNLFKILPNNTLSRAELSFEKGIVKNLHYGDILIKFNEILDSCDKKIPFISREMNFEKIKNAILKNGDVVIADAAEDEAVGKCTEIFNISQNEQIISGLHTIPCRPNIDFAQGFLGYYMNSNSYHSQLVPLMQGIKVLSLSKSSLQDTLITFPRTKKEQARIGTFFRHLDRLITLHQRKRGRLENIKKAMLEKMFPKNGADVPEVRFVGFTEAWEQRNTSYLGNFFKGQGYSKADLLPDGTPIILYGQLYTNYQFTITEVNTYAQKKKNTILSKGNEVIVPASGETAEDIARASAVRKKGVILGGDLNIIVPIPSMNAEFFALSLSNGFPQKKLAQKAQGKSVVHIHNSDIQEISITYPSLEEQNRIASFFRHLDRLITLHQRKVALLQNIKKACLEKMFV